MEQWKINRAGLIDFWYYDDEEFVFEDGRLLLRGSNGSGKSVTMQSFIPLLLDGNKTPSRLDPFGSKARKIENYLIGGDIEQDERTGYIYLEFVKPKAQKYITIAMGLRAKKNTKLDSWYFVITDGRRIGYDFYLYKNIGDKIALSKKELENRIGQGGKFFVAQKEYMSMVNEMLFGFDEIDSYDELIKLLIQLRSPKLSKDFKPTVIYEIMANALQTLTDEDLRPMSEAIENMDNIKSNLEMLEESQRSARKISNAYKNYNEYTLAEKAQDYIMANKKLNEYHFKLEKLGKNIADNKKIISELETKLEELDIEKELFTNKKKKLQGLDAYKLKEKEQELEEIIAQNEKDKKMKDSKLEVAKEKERELHYKRRELKEEIEKEESNIFSMLEEMEEYANISHFDEHKFLIDELKEKTDQKYNFNYTLGQVRTYKSKLKEALDSIKLGEQKKSEYDEQLKRTDKAKKDAVDKQKEEERHEVLLSEIKEEFNEKVYYWESNNKLLKIAKESLSSVIHAVDQYGEECHYEDIYTPVRISFDKIKSGYDKEKAIKEGEIETYNKNLEDLKKQIKEWETKKDPEPQREDKIIKNRKKLDDKNIPYIPLYKAFDFKDNLTEEQKGIIEEALLDMGILDALIVPPKYKDQILIPNKEIADKYIFADPKILQHELSQYLKIDTKDQKTVELEVLDDVLKSFLLDPLEQGTFISETGQYGLGILRGHVSKNYTPQFIGYEARKRYKAKKINELQVQVEEYEKLIENINREIGKIEQKITQLVNEKDQFPKTIDLETAFRDYKMSKDNYNHSLSILKEEEVKSQEIYEQWQKQKELIYELTKTITISPKVELFAEAVENMEEYQENMNDLQVLHNKYLDKKNMLQIQDEQYEYNLHHIDDLQSDINKIELILNKNKKELLQTKELLAEKDIKSIEDEIKECISRLEEIPKEREGCLVDKTKAEDDIKHNIKEKETFSMEYTKYNKLYNIFEDSFIAEYKLCYVELAVDNSMNNDDNIQIAKKILNAYELLLKQPKERQDYLTALQEKFHQNTGALAEYNLNMKNIFIEKEGIIDNIEDKEIISAVRKQKRIDIKGKFEGKEVPFMRLIQLLEDKIKEQQNLLKDSDRYLFEEILIHSISRKIRAKIQHSERWVKKMNQLMESMNTSSGLTLSLRWKKKKAEMEDQLATSELVDILNKDPRLLPIEEREKITKHFRSKLEEAKNQLKEMGQSQTFLSIIKEVLDYRQWFEFQLFFVKEGENKKELTNNQFFTFSGGEKAMAMYVPLFSAVYARYDGARKDSPRLISLDEAFAGVDENNIQDMFRLLVELDLSFIINSQILWGDYETVPSLAICELIRPNNAKFVSVIRYRWNGKIKELVVPNSEQIVEDEENAS
ncbi:MAG: TIGR02680 family protein [Eubacteriales bacterium]